MRYESSKIFDRRTFISNLFGTLFCEENTFESLIKNLRNFSVDGKHYLLVFLIVISSIRIFFYNLSNTAVPVKEN